MKAMRRWIALALCLVLCCAMLPQMALPARAETKSGNCGENLTWSLNTGTGVLTIAGSGEMENYNTWADFAPWYESRDSITQVVLPEGLTTIGDAAFFECVNLSGVNIPAGVTSVGSMAFYRCDGLQELAFPEGLKSVGGLAFCLCDGLTTVTFAAGLETIGESAFSNCPALKTIVLPDGMAAIGAEAFAGCISLTNVTIPAGLAVIEKGCFKGCTALTTVALPEGLAVIGESAFEGCALLTDLAFPAGLASIQKKAFSGCAGLTEASFPESLLELGEEAFSDCTGLQNVTILEGVQELGALAFARCTGLTSVNLPASLATIEMSIFSGCTALAAINVAEGNPNYCSENGVLFNQDKTVLIQYPAAKADASYAVPEGVTEIGSESFLGAAALAEVTLPEGLTIIKWRAFYDCPAMKSVRIPGSVTAMQGYAVGFVSDENGEATPIENFTIYGVAKTEAHTYARVNGFKFVFDNPFVDICEDDYSYDAVMWALENGITVGVDDTHFGTEEYCTREQIMTFLYHAKGDPYPETTNNPFLDVDYGAYYYRAVIWAVENHITVGVGDNRFGTGEVCTREQAMTFLYHAKGDPAPETAEIPFSDVQEDDYFCNAVLWAAENGITVGVGGGRFGVGDYCTREQIITFLYKAFGPAANN